MSLREKINQQFNAALKDKNKTLVSTLRLILASIKERDIANRSGGKKEDVKDDEIIKVLRKMKKQRQVSSDLYKKGGRNELLEIEEEEIKVIDTFLPKQLTEEETKTPHIRASHRKNPHFYPLKRWIMYLTMC